MSQLVLRAKVAWRQYRTLKKHSRKRALASVLHAQRRGHEFGLRPNKGYRYVVKAPPGIQVHLTDLNDEDVIDS